MRKIVLLLICSMMLAGSAAQALRFGTIPKTTVSNKRLVKFLPARNEALEKALKVHNLMTEIPTLLVMADQQKELQSQIKEVQKIYDDIKKCYERRLGRFKNASQVLAKLRQTYAQRTQNLETGVPYNEDSIVPRSLAEHNRLLSQKQDIEAELWTDLLENGQQWGGEMVDKKKATVPENLKEKLTGASLEQLATAEDVAINSKLADVDFDQVFKEMQTRFVQQLESVGVSFPKFDVSRPTDVYQVKKSLKELKEQYLTEAKEYIVQLDAQDAAHPKAVARRAARTEAKKKIINQVQEEFPELSDYMSGLDQQTPQQRQQIIVKALEKDMEGEVFLTETNAVEIDQKLARSKVNQAMIKNLQEQSKSYINDLKVSMPPQDFDSDQCDFS